MLVKIALNIYIQCFYCRRLQIELGHFLTSRGVGVFFITG